MEGGGEGRGWGEDERRRLKGQQGRGDKAREAARRKGCGEGAREEENGEESGGE